MVDAGLQAAFQKQGNDWHHLLPRYVCGTSNAWWWLPLLWKCQRKDWEYGSVQGKVAARSYVTSWVSVNQRQECQGLSLQKSSYPVLHSLSLETAASCLHS